MKLLFIESLETTTYLKDDTVDYSDRETPSLMLPSWARHQKGTGKHTRGNHRS